MVGARAPGHRAGSLEPRSPVVSHPPHCLPFTRDGQTLFPVAAGTWAVGGGADSSDKVVTGILQRMLLEGHLLGGGGK